MSSTITDALSTCMGSVWTYGDTTDDNRDDRQVIDNGVPPPPLTEAEKLALVMETYDLDYEKIKEYRETFDQLDVDNNELLDRGEMRNAFFFWGQEITDGELEDIFEKYDVEQNGSIEFPELVEMLAEKQANTDIENQYASKMKPHDKNDTGYIPKTKLYKGLREIDRDGFDFTENEMELKLTSMFKEVNKNEKDEVKYMDVIKLLRYKGLLA